MTLQEAKQLIYQQNGKIFGATFVTQDQRIRHMSCRLGVHKGVKGRIPKEVRQNQDDLFGLMTVYDFNADWKANDRKGAFRRINLNTLIRLKIRGREYPICTSL